VPADPRPTSDPRPASDPRSAALADPVRSIELVLASASPARRATLTAAGVPATVQVSAVDEDAVVARYGVSDPADVALVLARAKAEDVAAGIADGDALVLGCDSVLELDGEAHGKPADPAQAIARWQRMRGRSGVLHTGHWLVDARHPDDGGTGGTLGAVASTTVHFADLDDDEIAAYVATGEPLAVAGAFTVDGLGGAYVSGIEGDHHNVVGLSLPLLRELLRELGVPWHRLWRR
jgi:septum formation protein